MKTKHLVGTAFATLLMASCSNELPVQESGDSLFGSVPEGMVEYQFKLTGITPTVSYAATSVPLETAEMKVDSVTVIVTQIKPTDQKSAKVYGVFPATYKDNDKGGKIASIQMPKEIDLGTKEADGDKIRFVVIANRLWTDLEYDKATNKHSITTANTYGDVEALLATWVSPKVIEANPDQFPVKPVGLPMYDVVDGERPEDGDVMKITTVKFKRPIARFDVCNSTEGSLTFTKIGLANMRKFGNLLPLATLPAPEEGVLVTMPDFAPLPEGINEFTEDTESGKMVSTYQPGVFYLPPGAATDNLCLLLEAKLDGTVMNYTLPLTNAGGAIAVKPNTRYKVNIKKVNDDIYADYEVDQGGWGDGGDGGTGGGGTGGGGTGGGPNDYEHDFNTPETEPTPEPSPEP